MGLALEERFSKFGAENEVDLVISHHCQPVRMPRVKLESTVSTEQLICPPTAQDK